uniref:Mos1 transposase HTH domain-containing protein n=1 Tax=Graphocephala atropunctata TaxID=36148 RepID=A0A1B6LW34_9HEMI
MRGLVELTVVMGLLYNKVRIKSRGLDLFLDQKSLLTVTSWMTGTSGIRPTVKVQKRGFHKMADVDPETKQRVVVEFLTGEDVPPEEIRRRLEVVYGNRTVDVSRVHRWARKPGDSEFRLGGRLMQRSVIQFLTAEGERPLEILGRIRAVYRTLPYSRCTAWRWATRYRQGDTGVGDRVRQGRIPDRLRLNRTDNLRR